MDIYAEVKNFSFYSEKSTFYVGVRVIEKRLHLGCHPYKTKFEEVAVGKNIGLKVSVPDLKKSGKLTENEFVQLLLSRYLVLVVDKWEDAKEGFQRSTPRFGISDARQCAIFQEK